MTTKTMLITQFDDTTTDEYGTWSQICTAHVKELKVTDSQIDNDGNGICGVIGCNSESDHYIDFKESEKIVN